MTSPLSKNSRRRKEKELRTLIGIQKAGVPKEYKIALEGMIKRLKWILDNADEGKDTSSPPLKARPSKRNPEDSFIVGYNAQE